MDDLKILAPKKPIDPEEWPDPMDGVLHNGLVHLIDDIKGKQSNLDEEMKRIVEPFGITVDQAKENYKRFGSPFGERTHEVTLSGKVAKRVKQLAKSEGVDEETMIELAVARFATNMPDDVQEKLALKRKLSREIRDLDGKIDMLKVEQAGLQGYLKQLQADQEEADWLLANLHRVPVIEWPERVMVMLDPEGKLCYDPGTKVLAVFGSYSCTPDVDMGRIEIELRQLFGPRGEPRYFNREEFYTFALSDEGWEAISLNEVCLPAKESLTMSRTLFEQSGGVWDPWMLYLLRGARNPFTSAPKEWWAVGPTNDLQHEGDLYVERDSVELELSDHGEVKNVILLYGDEAIAARKQASNDELALYKFGTGNIAKLLTALDRSGCPAENIGFVLPEGTLENLREWAKGGSLFTSMAVSAVEDPRHPGLWMAHMPIQDLKAAFAARAEEVMMRNATEWGNRAADTWQRLNALKPWGKLSPFYIDLKAFGLKALGRMKVTVAAANVDHLDDTWRAANMVKVEWPVAPDSNWSYVLAAMAEVGRGIPSFACALQSADDHEDLDIETDDRWFIALTCAMAAAIDLLTREVRVVERKKSVVKHMKVERTAVKIDYNPVVYAPRVQTVTVVGDGNIRRKLEEQEKERQRKEQAAREEAERLARQRVKHRVPSFIRNLGEGRHMSLKQRKRLLDMLAANVEPIDRFGKPLPIPTEEDNWTIVLEHERGDLDPEVVSKEVLALIEEYRKGR